MPFCIVNDDIIRTNADIKVRIKKTSIEQSLPLVLYTLEYLVGTRGDLCNDIQVVLHSEEQRNDREKEREAICDGYREILLKTADFEYDSLELPLLWNFQSSLTCPEVTELAKDMILEFLDYYDYTIYLVVPFYRNPFMEEEFFHDLSEHIDRKYTPPESLFEADSHLMGNGQRMIRDMLKDSPEAYIDGLVKLNTLDELMSRMEEPFVTQLFRYIDERNMTDVEVYKGAMIDRKLFSKIRKGNGYTPHKDTILALAISMKLNLDETQDLLKSAGYILTDSSKFDLIIGYFIENEDYNLFKINEALYKYGLNGLRCTRE